MPVKAEGGKAGKVAIAGDKRAALSNCHGCVLRVGNVLAHCVATSAEPCNLVKMTHRRAYDATAWVCRKLFYKGQRNLKRSRLGVDSGVCHDADKPHGDQDTERKRLGPING
jgi:hypothetical protein